MLLRSLGIALALLLLHTNVNAMKTSEFVKMDERFKVGYLWALYANTYTYIAILNAVNNGQTVEGHPVRKVIPSEYSTA